MRYLEPDSFDTKKGTMSVALPHFSWDFGAKLTKEEIDVFLDKHCMQMAIDEGLQKQAASQLEPYVQAKVKAMELTEQATVELVQGTLNYLSGRFQGDESGSIEIGGKAVTAVVRVTYEGDKDMIQGGLEDALSDALMHNWDDLKFNDRIDKVMGTQYAGATAGKLLGNSNGIARMAGKLMEGDHEGAAQELGGVMQNIDSKAEAVTKGASWLASLGNLGMTYWKSNKIDELYQIYKNGAEDLWGNYVIPGDRETFIEYLNTSSGFTESKSIYRFYNMDKVGEVCEKYGWDFKTYSEMPEKYRNIFRQRAEDGLMKYFELRRQQEQRADEIKKQEKAIIKEMMNPYYGVLTSGNFKEFFHEESDSDFSMTSRLERIVNVRRFISDYINLKELERLSKIPDSYNMGTLVNEWVSLASSYPKSEAIDRFCEYLDEIGLLKESMKSNDTDEADESGVLSLSEQAGTWYPKENNGRIMLRIYKNEPSDVKSGSMYMNFNTGIWYNGMGEYDEQTGTLAFIADHGLITGKTYNITIEVIDKNTIKIVEDGQVLYRSER